METQLTPLVAQQSTHYLCLLSIVGEKNFICGLQIKKKNLIGVVLYVDDCVMSKQQARTRKSLHKL